MTAALVTAIEANAEALTARVLAEMYKNPFWLERYGERAQTHGRQDGLFHIKYLAEALRANDASPLEAYARWLQQLLTARGMCTRHIDENFARLATAISMTVPGSQRAVAMLEAARRALHYKVAPARDLQTHAPALAKRAAAELATLRPAQADRTEDDLATFLSYAADAAALAKPAVLTDYAAWMAGFCERRGIPRAYVDDCLATLRRAIDAELPGVALPLDEPSKTP
jgi:hypothetical protein